MASPPPQMRAIDRLSGLPDSVLTHLLSFLPTKTCVATSILSRRWRFLWQYVPFIGLYNQNQDTVSRFLSLHKLQGIDDFRLSFENENSHNPQIEAWIIAAIERNVRTLDLSFSYLTFFVLPSRLFTCETLAHLTLRRCRGVPTTTVFLPRLKNLSLIQFRFESYESLPRLLSGCPVLEELKIEHAEYSDLVLCNISSPTLKKLELDFALPIGNYDNGDYKLELNTPALEDLYLYGLLSDVETGPLRSLSRARVGFLGSGDKIHSFLYHTSVLNFLKRLNDVKSLKVYFSSWMPFWDVPKISIEQIDSMLAGWTVSFNNLTKLDLFAQTRFLPNFLESANNLQFLRFREREGKRYHRDLEVESWIEPQCVPRCLVYHLTTIRLGGLYGENIELEMIRYLLKNAQVLETMEISFLIDADESDQHKKAKLIEEISLFELGSPACQLIFP